MTEPARGRRTRSKRQAFVEAVSKVLYKGDWPARLWGLVRRHSRRAGSPHARGLAAWLERAPARVHLRSAHRSDDARSFARSRLRARRERAPGRALARRRLRVSRGHSGARRAAAFARRARPHAAPSSRCSAITICGRSIRCSRPRSSKRGAEVLVNRSVRLPEPHDAVHVVGLDEPWSGEADPVAAIAGVPPGAVKILLCHAPDGFPLFPSGFALYLAGHTHGGHIALPVGFRSCCRAPEPSAGLAECTG